MSLSCISNSHRVSFSSIKPTVRVGESVLKEFSNTYPALKSPSLIAINMHEKGVWCVPKFRSFLDSVTSLLIADRSAAGLFKTPIKTLVKNSGVANCGEQRNLMKDMFEKRGIKTQSVSFCINNNLTHLMDYKKRPCNDHCFLLLDAKKGADYSNPKTWGSKAVIADPWSKTIKSAFEMIEQYKDKFNFDSNSEYMLFREDYL